MMPSRFTWRDAVYLGCFIANVPLGVAFAVRDQFGALLACLLVLLLVMLVTIALPQRAPN
jgi:hypothetical protein